MRETDNQQEASVDLDREHGEQLGRLEDVDPSEEQLASIRGALEPLRVEPVMTYELDRPGRAVARECGVRLAEQLSMSEWTQSALERREELARDFQRELGQRLGTEVHPVEFNAQMTDLGGFDPETKQIELRADLLEHDDPRELLMTLAHEQRHAWQEDVIDGRLRHPGGSEARERLREAKSNYGKDSRNFRAYVRNELERDGEKFAYLTYREFVLEQRRP